MKHNHRIRKRINKFFLVILSIAAIPNLLGNSIIPAGKSAGYAIYNQSVTTATGLAGAGGFAVSGTGLATGGGTDYFLKVSFNGGTSGGGTFNKVGSAYAEDGTWVGNGLFTPNVATGAYHFEFSHTALQAISGYPGDDTNDGTIHVAVMAISGSPILLESGFTMDLVSPTMQTASISSNNSNSEWATTGDRITISFTTDETLSSDASYAILGNISGVAVNSSGSGTSWSAYNDVSTHAEGIVTYAIGFYDANENFSNAYISAPTDGSTVTVDTQAPYVTTSISSNNSTSSLAKTGEDVTLTISSTEIISAAPTLTIDGNAVTLNPNTATTSYSGVRTMEAGDTQGTVVFSLTQLNDRAGNTANAQTAASDGTSVTFDSVDPTLTGITIESDNAISSNLAKPGDVVTLTYYTSEQAQTPVVTIASENATETNPSGDLLSWFATKTMDADDANGTVGLTIDFYDLAGNQGTQATGIMTGSNVTFDKTAPTANTVSVASSNTSSSNYAMNGDVISVTIDASEDLQGNTLLSPYGISNATIAGNGIASDDISQISSTRWKISYTLDGTENDGAASYSLIMADLAGNTTTSSSAGTNVVVDNTKPTLTLVTIESNNANTAYAKATDVITMNITADEDLTAAPTVFIAGRAATVNDVGGSATQYTATLTTNSTDTQGEVAISINFTDLTGNAGDAVIATTNNSTVTFDRTAPTLSAVTVTSNNTNTAYAKEGDIVTLSFSSSENVQDDPVVTIDGNAATVSGGSTTWTATYTMQNGDTEGETNFTIDFVDIAGNNGTQVSALTTGNKIVYDETLPQLTTVDISSNNSNGSTLAKVGDVITIAITANDANGIQTPTVTIAGNAASVTGTNGGSVFSATYAMESTDNTGALDFTVDFIDMANNAGTQVTAPVNDSDGGIVFDKQAPSFSTITIASNNSNDAALSVVNDVITLNLTSDEDIKTGADPSVTINGNNASVTRNSSTTFTATYTMSSPTDDGIDGSAIPFSISSYDDPTGNTGATVSLTTDGSAVIYDNTIPGLGTVTISSDNTYDYLAKSGDLITLTIVSTENINSPTVSLLGSTADVTVTEGADASNWTATKIVTGGHSDGTAAININFTDLAGNSGAAVTDLTAGSGITVDKSVPTITTASIVSDNVNGGELAVPGNTITLTIIASEDIIEPTVTIATQAANISAGADGQNWTASYTMTENEDNGTIPFTIAFQDSAGNDGGTHTVLANDVDGSEVSYDKTQPELSNIVLQSDNSFNSGYAKSGSVITLTFDANEQLKTSTVIVSIAGENRTPSKSASWNGTKESWIATYTMTDATDDNGGLGTSIPFTIDYVDLNGYAGSQETHITSSNTITFDKTAPSLTTFSYSSNNSNLANRAKVGDVVTVSIESSELLQTPELTIAGNTVANEAAGGTNAIWTGSYAMQNTDSDGLIDLSMTFMDYAGNSGATAVATTDGSAVTFDRTLPTLTTVTLTSNNSNNTLAAVGDIVTLSIIADESLISTPAVSIKGNNVTPTGSGVNWAATYTMQDTDIDGDVPFTIAFFDLAANAGIDVASTTDGGTVTFDGTSTNLSTIAVDLTPGSDTGRYDDDDLTNDQTPTFSVTGLSALGAVGDSLFLLVDGVKRVVTKATTNTVSFTISDNVDSLLAHKVLPYEATVISKDASGNLSDATAALSFTIDRVAPTLGSVLNLITEEDSGFLNDDDITSNNRPSLEVSALTAGDTATIRVYYNAANAGLNNVLIHEEWMSQPVIDTMDIASTLADDVYTFFYTLEDAAGNVSINSNTMDLTIDATGPSAPNEPDLATAFDSGTSSTDNITNATDLQFDVSGLTIGDSVYITNTAGTIVGGEIAGSTTQTVEVLGATSTGYKAYAIDPSGNTSLSSNPLTVAVDQTATIVTGVSIDLDVDSDSGFLDNDNNTNVNTPTLNLSGLVATDSVWLYIDDVLSKRGLAASTTLSLTTDALSDNNYEFKIKAKDFAGNVSEFSPSLNIIVDTTPYTITSNPDLLESDDSGFLTDDNLTNVRVPSFEFDELSSKADSIKLFVNNGISTQFVIGGRKTADILTDSLTIPNGAKLDEGEYVLSYVVIDSAGNESVASAGTTIRIDFTSPDKSTLPDLRTDDDAGFSANDNLTNVRETVISTTGLNPGEIRNLYKIDNTTTPPTTVLIDSSGVGAGIDSLGFSVINNEEGTFQYYAVIVDTAGNRSTFSDTLSIRIDTTPSDLTGVIIDLDDASDTGKLNNDDETADTTPTFTITGLPLNDSLSLSFDGANPLKEHIDNVSLSMTATGTQIPLSDQTTYTIEVTCTDSAGNSDVAPASLDIVVDDVAETVLPSANLVNVDDTGWDDSDNITSKSNPSFDIDGITPFDYKVRLYVATGIDTVLVKEEYKADNYTSANMQIPAGDGLGSPYLIDGPHSILYTIEDDAGNISEYSDSLDIIIDSTSTDVSTVSIDLKDDSDTGTLSSDNITSESGPTFTLNNVTSGDSILLSVTDPLGVQNYFRVLADSTTIDISGTLSEQGLHTIAMISKDVAGNLSDTNPNSLTVNFDSEAPDVSGIVMDFATGYDSGRDTADKLTNETEPVITISNTTANDSIFLYFTVDCTDPVGDAIPNCTTAVRDSLKTVATGTSLDVTLGHPYIDSINPDGEYTITVKARDLAGNLSVISPSQDFVIDSTPESLLPSLNLIAAYDRGIYDNDDITNLRTFDLELGPVTPYDFYIRVYRQTGISTELVLEERKNLVLERDTLIFPEFSDAPANSQYWLITGTHSIKYTIEDDAGNVSGFSEPLNITIDVTPPPSLGLPDLLTLDDFGESDSDNLTAPTRDNGQPQELDQKVRIDMEDSLSTIEALPGFKWALYQFEDASLVDADNEFIGDAGTDLTALDSGLFKGGRYDFLNTTNLPAGEQVNGVEPATKLDTAFVPVNTGDPSYNYYFVTQQVDTAGNRSAFSKVLSVTVDYEQPTVTLTPESNLVRSADGVVNTTFTFSEEMDSLSSDGKPRIDIDYPEVDASLNLLNQELVEGISDDVWSFAIPLNSDGLDSMDGAITLSFQQVKDMAGNSLLGSSFDGSTGIIVDNTLPLFQNLTPLSGSYNNNLNNFGYSLSEDIESGFVTFTNTVGNIVDSVYLSNGVRNELNAAPAVDAGSFNLNDPNIVEGLYTVTFTGIDTAGNKGETVINNYTFDQTVPTVVVSFSQLVASADSIVTVTGSFSEPVKLYPKIGFTFQGPESDNIDSTDMYILGSCDCLDDIGEPISGCVESFNQTNCVASGGSYVTGPDTSLWLYDLTIPSGMEHNGLVDVVVYADDRALNTLISDSTSENYGQAYLDSVQLEIDNTVTTAIFTYENLSNPDLTDLADNPTTVYGAGGDNIRVYVQLNESMRITNPVPTLSATFGGGSGNGTELTLEPFTSVDLDPTGQPDNDGLDNSFYIFDITLPDSLLVQSPGDTVPVDDGKVSFQFVAKDRANNTVLFPNNHVGHDTFTVDNKHPDAFMTGLVDVHGPNPVQPWITGIVDSIGIQVPIPVPGIDQSLYEGGTVQFEVKNALRGLFYQPLSYPNDSTYYRIVNAGEGIQFFRYTSSILDALPPSEGDLSTGDSLLVRAVMTDRYGNVTKGTPSTVFLRYDPTKPALGEVVVGVNTNFGNTILSNDTAKVEWTEFVESNEFESGVERYELRIDKYSTSNDTTVLMNWTSFDASTRTFSDTFLLEHDHEYSASIRAFDVAGNISDTLQTDRLKRLNTAPIIVPMDSAKLYEDTFWKDTLSIADLDLDVLQGDTVSFKAYTVRTNGSAALDTASVSINKITDNDLLAELVWTPTQDDTGDYSIRIIATDLYDLKDTLFLPLHVEAVNDTPVFAFPRTNPDAYYVHTWVEDSLADEINLSRYTTDVDNDLDSITYLITVFDTSELDEDYPIGQVFGSPGVSLHLLAEEKRKYLGFDPNSSRPGIKTLTGERIDRINSSRSNPAIACTSYIKSYENVPDSVFVRFYSRKDYYGASHRIKFLAFDPVAAADIDTLNAVIAPNNDPPVIADENLAVLSNGFVLENDSIKFEFGQYVTDIDDTSLTFTIYAGNYQVNSDRDRVTIRPSIAYDSLGVDSVRFTSSSLGDSVLFIPDKLWDDHVRIHLLVEDRSASDTASFLLDVLHVDRPKLSVSVLQQNAFTQFLQVIITDTASKTENLTMEVQNQKIDLDTIAEYTYSGHLSFESSGSYSIDVFALAHVGDTSLTENFALVAGRSAGNWYGSSYDGKFSVKGDPGAISYDQAFLIADSNLFEQHFYDKASYVLGAEDFEFNEPVEIKILNDRTDLAIYRRNNGITWAELPSLNRNGEIFTLSDESGYFRLGPKTIIVPEQTAIHQNYPNPFNPTTTVTYDVGLMDGLKQNVSIDVYNLLGQNIITLVKNQDQIGQFKVQWDGYDKYGQQMGSGIYFIQLTTKTGIVRNKKMMLLK